MASGTVQDSLNKDSTAEVYEKTSDILSLIHAHAQKGCTHCLALLKSGLRPTTTSPPDAENTKPVTKRFGYV